MRPRTVTGVARADESTTIEADTHSALSAQLQPPITLGDNKLSPAAKPLSAAQRLRLAKRKQAARGGHRNQTSAAGHQSLLPKPCPNDHTQAICCVHEQSV